MKRLSAQIGITYFSVSAVAFYLSLPVVWILFALSAAAAGVLALVRRTRRTVFVPLMALSAAVACAVNIGYTCLKVQPIQEKYSGSTRRVEATLIDEGYTLYNTYYYRLNVDVIDGAEADFRLLLKTNTPVRAEPYDTFIFSADVSVTANDYYRSKGYFLTAVVPRKQIAVREAEHRPLGYRAVQLRRAFRTALDTFLPHDTASLCKAVFIGDKYALSADTRADFRYAGASYFIVVSGVHFSIICLLIMQLLRSFRVHRFIASGVMLFVVLLYMFLTGFQPSVVRSGIMMIVFIIGRLIRRIHDPHCSLGIAGIVSTVILSPYGAGDIGLILSFAATFGIITWADPNSRKWSVKEPVRLHHRMLNAVVRVLSVSLAASIMVFPISVYVFGAFSTVTLISSLLLYLPIELILILTLLLCALFYLGPLRYAAMMLSWPLYALCRFVLWVIGGLSSLPFSYVYIGHDFFYIWTGITVVLGLIVLLLRRRRLLPYAVLCSAILLIGGTVFNAVVDLRAEELKVFSCADGMTVGLNYHGRLYMFSFDADYRSAYRIADSLADRYEGAELAVCSTRKEYRNYGFLSDREFAIRRCLLYDKLADGSEQEMTLPGDDGVILLDDGVTLYVYDHHGRWLSCLRVGETTVVILPPKISYADIPAEFRSADMMVMSKPGEDCSRLRCDTLIISNTGDTAAQIAEMMKDSCRTVLCTDGEDIRIRME